MSGVVFLGIAVVVSVVGTLVLWARNRTPDTPDASIEEFRSKMAALSDEVPESGSGQRRGV
ncbi:MAG: hypothetical protein ACR2OH_13240 [Microthrixaceae bacterium]